MSFFASSECFFLSFPGFCYAFKASELRMNRFSTFQELELWILGTWLSDENFERIFNARPSVGTWKIFTLNRKCPWTTSILERWGSSIHCSFSIHLGVGENPVSRCRHRDRLFQLSVLVSTPTFCFNTYKVSWFFSYHYLSTFSAGVGVETGDGASVVFDNLLVSVSTSTPKMPVSPIPTFTFVYLEFFFLQMKNEATHNCLDTMGRKSGEALGLSYCHGLGGNQVFAYTKRQQIMSDDNCLDSASAKGPVKLVRCHGMGGNQAWNYNEEVIAHRLDDFFVIVIDR